MNRTRRDLILGGGVAAAPLRPPWTSEAAVLDRCTGCGDCATACPNGIISIGAGRLPEVDFHHGECTFCGECARVCAADVFEPVAGRAFSHVMAIDEACLSAAGVECRACQDSCPETAIGFRPRLGLPPAPVLDALACTGCGACISSCPVEAIGISRVARESIHA